MKAKEYITHEKGSKDAWVCKCGNMPPENGFETCDADGNLMEADKNSNWAGLYVCCQCGRVINMHTLEIVGQNPNVMCSIN